MVYRTVLIVFMFIYASALEADDGGHVPVTFEGFGRVYSLEDEMAKPMCQGNVMHMGEYLIHYNRLGNKGVTERYYPFLIYVPAVGESRLVTNPAPARITFSSCLEVSEHCASPTIKSGSRWSHMIPVFAGGIGEHMLIVGAVKYRSAAGGDPMKFYKNLVEEMNGQFIDGPMAEIHSQSFGINMPQVEAFLYKNMPQNFATRKFNVVNPGDCG